MNTNRFVQLDGLKLNESNWEGMPGVILSMDGDYYHFVSIHNARILLGYLERLVETHTLMDAKSMPCIKPNMAHTWVWDGALERCIHCKRNK